MKEQKDSEMRTLRQERFPSGNPDLGRTNAIPRCEKFDLRPVPLSPWGICDSEFTFTAAGKQGNCVRKDGKA